MTRTRRSLLSPATLFPSRLLAVSHVVQCSYTLHCSAFVLAMSVLFILYIDLPSHYVTLSTTCIIAYVPSFLPQPVCGHPRSDFKLYPCY